MLLPWAKVLFPGRSTMVALVYSAGKLVPAVSPAINRCSSSLRCARVSLLPLLQRNFQNNSPAFLTFARDQCSAKPVLPPERDKSRFIDVKPLQRQMWTQQASNKWTHSDSGGLSRQGPFGQCVRFVCSMPTNGCATPVSMPRRQRGFSQPERWPNGEGMKQSELDTDKEARKESAPKVRKRASPSVQEGSNNSIEPVLSREKGDVVEKVLEGLRRRPASPEVVRGLMDVHGPYMGRSKVINVFLALQKQQDWRRAYHMFFWMKKQPWHQPDLRFYTSLVNLLGKHGQGDLVTILHQELLLEKLHPDHRMFIALIYSYCHVRMYNKALAVFEDMKRESGPSKPNTVTCNILINALCRGGQYKTALKILADMESDRNGLKGCKPDVFTADILIAALCKEGHIYEAENFLRGMGDPKKDSLPAPTLITYNTLIDACGKNQMTEKAEAFLAEMRDLGLKPNVITYTAMIDIYGGEGLYEEAKRTFDEMQTAGCKPSNWTFTALIAAHGRSGQLEAAKKAFESMVQKQLEPTDVTFLALIDAFAKAGRCKEASEWFMRMEKAGFKPTAVSYRALMDGYGIAGRYQEAADLFLEMQAKGIAPTTETYTALLVACNKCRTGEEALVLLDALMASGKDAELAICRLIMAPAGEGGLWENANKLFLKVGEANRIDKRCFFNSLLDILWAFGLKSRAKRVLKTARQMGAYRKSEFCSFDEREWELDLHQMSPGAAQTMVLQWLGESWTALARGAKIPSEIRIVTGWGKHARTGLSSVKVAVFKLLGDLRLPMGTVEGNGGRVTLTGAELLAWLQSAGGRKELKKANVMRPGPEHMRRRQ